MKTKNLLCSIIGTILLFFTTYAHADDLNKYIFVSNAWVLVLPPTQTTTAAYMTITNKSPKEMILVSASSDIAGATEIHQMSDMNGMMHMVMFSNLHIPAQGKMTFQPGGFHIMLINLKKHVNINDIVPITLHFQDGSKIVVNAQAKAQYVDVVRTTTPGMKM